MANQRAGSSSSDPLVESAGCCGLLARMLSAGVVIVALAALAALGLLLISDPPDRWQGIADPNAHPLALVVDPTHPQTVYAGTEQGNILISRDGGQNWRETHQGLPSNTPISALALLPSGIQRGAGDAGIAGATHLLAGTSKGAYRSFDGGNTWHSAGPGIPVPTIVDAVSALPDGTLLAGTVGSGVFALPPGATTWQRASSGLPPQSDIYAFLPLAQPGHVLVALISGGVYGSQDDGMTWAESDRGLSGASGVNVFSFLALSDQNAGGANGADEASGSILAGTSQGIYVSRDHGATWTSDSVGIGTTRVISLAHDPLAPSEVFAGADSGVYVSRNGGMTWHALGYGLPAEQHVGAVGVVHSAGSTQVILASVDQLYRYPGQWLLASEPWRALGFSVLIVLALTLIGFIGWQAHSLMAR